MKLLLRLSAINCKFNAAQKAANTHTDTLAHTHTLADTHTHRLTLTHTHTCSLSLTVSELSNSFIDFLYKLISNAAPPPAPPHAR